LESPTFRSTNLFWKTCTITWILKTYLWAPTILPY
jgi:hypothetical protein